MSLSIDGLNVLEFINIVSKFFKVLFVEFPEYPTLLVGERCLFIFFYGRIQMRYFTLWKTHFFEYYLHIRFQALQAQK